MKICKLLFQWIIAIGVVVLVAGLVGAMISVVFWGLVQMCYQIAGLNLWLPLRVALGFGFFVGSTFGIYLTVLVIVDEFK